MKLNLIVLNLLIFVIISGYLPLSAKIRKKYSDTVILKNGTVINNIKATDSVLITTEDGVTTIYKKKDISEIKKDGISQDSKFETEGSKKEIQQEIEIVKKEKTNSPNEKWSNYQGAMKWEDAVAICKKSGLRLPSINELRSAFIDGTTESWKKDGLFYWSSTPGQGDHSYNIGITDGHYFADDRMFVNDVRCIR